MLSKFYRPLLIERQVWSIARSILIDGKVFLAHLVEIPGGGTTYE